MDSAAGLHKALGSIWVWDVDEVIKKLLSVRSVKKPEKFILKESEISGLCQSARNIFLQQPMLLELESPVKIMGDVHGQYEDLLQFFDIGGFPPESNYLFMGDYVDKGRLSLECICLLLAYKVKYHENFFLLRGNHESSNINKEYGFYDECKRRHSVKVWKTFNSCFDCMPVAAIIEEKIFCCHGGISQDLNTLDQIRRLSRPTDIPTSGILCDLLWADPDPYIKKGYARSDRGVSYLFSADELIKFLNAFKLDLVCRGHQVVEDGYEFFAKRKLVTVFSAKNYCGEFDNPGAMMSVDKDLMCSFTVLKPEPKRKISKNLSLANNPPDFRNGRI